MDLLTHRVTYDEYRRASGGRRQEAEAPTSSPEPGRRFRRTSPLTRSRAAVGGGSSGEITSSVFRFNLALRNVSPGQAGEVNEASRAVGCEHAVTPGPSLQNPDYSNTNNPVWEVLAHGAHT